jgi:hypothetical protein
MFNRIDLQQKEWDNVPDKKPVYSSEIVMKLTCGDVEFQKFPGRISRSSVYGIWMKNMDSLKRWRHLGACVDISWDDVAYVAANSI